MIKKLIFDLDNTLIMWKEEYNIAVQKALEMTYSINNKEMSDIINNYADEFENDLSNPKRYYDRQVFLDYINKKTNYNLNMEFLDNWLKCNVIYSTPDTLEKSVHNTLEYLSNKYELVILTDWFGETQIERLKKVDIYKYFSKLFAAKQYAKPKKEAFLQAIGENTPEECAMIGDSIEIDILGAQNVGISNLVLLDNKGNTTRKELNGVHIIKNLAELKTLF